MTSNLAGLGRLCIPDPRRAAWPMPAAAASQVLSGRRRMFWILRGGPDDQGSAPHCVAFAGVHMLRAYPVLNEPVDRVALYRECQRNDWWPGEGYDGTSVDALMKVLKRRGYISEYRWATSVGPLVDHLLWRGPVLMGTDWTTDMANPDAHGYLAPSGKMLGGHAYMLIGVNLDRENPDGSRGAVRMLNSWGVNWGINGRAWISLDHIEDLISADGEAVAPYEVKALGGRVS